MDAKNSLQKPNSPPLRVGHCNFISHPINTSMTKFMIHLKYRMEVTKKLTDITVFSIELGKMVVSIWRNYSLEIILA